MLKYCINFPSQSRGLRWEGRTLLLAGVNRLGRRWSNFSMYFLDHGGASDTPHCADTMLNHNNYFPSQSSGLRFDGRGLLSARLDRLGQLHGTNLGTASLVHTGPTDTQSIEEPPIENLDITDKDVETDENLWNLYERWQRIYRKVPLDPNENQRRFKTFKDEARFIHQFENDPTSTSGLNVFSDLTNDEFRSTYLLCNRPFMTYRDEVRCLHLQGKQRKQMDS